MTPKRATTVASADALHSMGINLLVGQLEQAARLGLIPVDVWNRAVDEAAKHETRYRADEETAEFERECAERYMEEIGANLPASVQRERALRLAEGAPVRRWEP